MARKYRFNYPIVALIASKNPVAALEVTVASLFKGGASRVIVVDDGSDSLDAADVFAAIKKQGAEVVHLPKNVGKAQALKQGFRQIPTRSIIVQTDDDTIAGDLRGPAEMLRSRKADIVDIRIETIRSSSVLAVAQEMSYWLMNAIAKRIQDYARARLWMSGASVMYNHKAGKELILGRSHTITEDTEGLFRARAKGHKVRYYDRKDAQFLTMVPEDFRGLRKQWQRWAMGNGQVIGLYGLGAGNVRIFAVNLIAWIDLLVWPVVPYIYHGVLVTLAWTFGSGVILGILCAAKLKSWRIALVGVLFPLLSALWAYHALEGLVRAYVHARSGKQMSLTWVSPKRTQLKESLAA